MWVCYYNKQLNCDGAKHNTLFTCAGCCSILSAYSNSSRFRAHLLRVYELYVHFIPCQWTVLIARRFTYWSRALSKLSSILYIPYNPYRRAEYKKLLIFADQKINENVLHRRGYISIHCFIPFLFSLRSCNEFSVVGS